MHDYQPFFNRAFLTVDISNDRADDDQSLDDLLIVSIHTQKCEARHHQTEDHGADNRAENAPPPAGERCAADHRRSDGVKLVHHAHAGLRRFRAGGGNDTGETRKKTGNGVDLDKMQLDIDAGHPGGLHVGPDRIGELAITRVAQRKMKSDGDEQEDDDRPRAGTDRREALGREGDRLTLGIPFGDAARGDHHAQRRYEGRYARHRDEHAIDDTGNQAKTKADGERHHHGHIGERRIDRPGEIAALRETHGDHGRHRHHRPRTEVYAAGNDDLGDPDGDNADDGNLKDHDRQALRAAEKALPLHEPSEQFEDQGDADQHGQNVQLLRQLASFCFDRLGLYAIHNFSSPALPPSQPSGPPVP